MTGDVQKTAGSLSFFWVAAVFLFLLSFLYCFTVWRIFPYGIVQGDTGTYLNLTYNFHIFQFNPEDWARTIPFGWLLRFGLLFPNPTGAVFLACAVLSSINFALLFWMTLGLVRSLRVAFLFSLLVLVWEIVSGHVILQSLLMLADPLFGHLVLTGSLLILGGWMHKKPAAQIIGYAVLGIAAFVKPAGVALFPVWALFAFFSFGKDLKHFRVPRQWKMLCIFLLLLAGPNLFWSGRNFFIYGSFKPTAYGGLNFIERVLPLVKDSDSILDDPAKNTAFIRSLRTFEQKVGTGYNEYMWGSKPGLPSPWRWLEQDLQKSVYGNRDLTAYENIKMFFMLDPILNRVSLNIIRQHPLAYAKMFLTDYNMLFAPVSAWGGDIIWLQVPARDFYPPIFADYDATQRSTYFPPDGKPNLTQSDEPARHVIARFSDTLRVVLWLKKWQPVFQLPAIHILFLISIVFLWWKKKSNGAQRDSINLTHVAVCIAMFSATAISLNVLTSMVELGLARYALPAEMPMDIILLLAPFLVVLWIVERIRTLQFLRKD